MHQQPAHAPFGPNNLSNAGHSSGVSSRISSAADPDPDLDLELDLGPDPDLDRFKARPR